MKITTYAPASIGNVSLGFDLLGAAVKPVDGSILGDLVTVTSASEFSLTSVGRFADSLPHDPQQNIVTRCYQYFQRRLLSLSVEQSQQKCQIQLDKNLPIGSGLGSSAVSIVAACLALNEFYQQPFSQEQLLVIMGELESQISGSLHYDNVAPCFLGGMTLVVGQGEHLVQSLPVVDNWYWVICYSGISVSTAAARDILPADYPIKTTLDFGRQLAVFVDALHRKDTALAAAMIKDVIAEPYRKSLLPNFDQARQYVCNNGGLAFGISGSGPTVFALCDNLRIAEQLQKWLHMHYIQTEDGFSHICQLDTQGARVLAQ